MLHFKSNPKVRPGCKAILLIVAAATSMATGGCLKKIATSKPKGEGFASYQDLEINEVTARLKIINPNLQKVVALEGKIEKMMQRTILLTCGDGHGTGFLFAGDPRNRQFHFLSVAHNFTKENGTGSTDTKCNISFMGAGPNGLPSLGKPYGLPKDDVPARVHYRRSPYEWDFAVGSFEFEGAVEIPEVYTLTDASRFEKSPLIALGYPAGVQRDGGVEDKRRVGAAVALRHQCGVWAREAESGSDSESARRSAYQASQCKLHQQTIFRAAPLPYRYDTVNPSKLGNISAGGVTSVDEFLVGTDVDGGPGLSGGPLYDPLNDVLIGMVKWAVTTKLANEGPERASDRLYAPITAQRLTTRVIESFCADARDEDFKASCRLLRERVLDD